MKKGEQEQNSQAGLDASPRPAPGWSFRRTVGPAYDLFDGEGNEIATIESRTHAAMIVRAVNTHDALVAALIKARLIIREWQGMGMSPEAEGDVWAIYDRNAPEMKAINAVLALASDTQEAK